MTGLSRLWFLPLAALSVVLVNYDKNAKAAEYKSKPMAISMDVSLQKPKQDEYVLHVTLTCNMQNPLTVYQSSLPWKSRYSMLLVAVKTDASGSIIEQELMIDDPGPSKLTIKPGETLSGQLSLNKRFPGLREALKDRDVLIFWSYQLQPLEAALPERVGGWLLIPKGQK